VEVRHDGGRGGARKHTRREMIFLEGFDSEGCFSVGMSLKLNTQSVVECCRVVNCA